jgi:hypothetical protein
VHKKKRGPSHLVHQCRLRSFWHRLAFRGDNSVAHSVRTETDFPLLITLPGFLRRLGPQLFSSESESPPCPSESTGLSQNYALPQVAQPNISGTLGRWDRCIGGLFVKRRLSIVLSRGRWLGGSDDRSAMARWEQRNMALPSNTKCFGATMT